MVHTPARSVTALWPPDDTEESIMGIDWHQMDITSLRIGINELAVQLAGDGSLPWQATGQTTLLGCRRPDGTAYKVMPDIYVFPHPIDGGRSSYNLRQDGPPVLIVEVASKSTYRSDLNLERGKGWAYAHAGVAEYLVLDPRGQYVPEVGRGWRLEQGAYRPWERDAEGHWRSTMLPVRIGAEEGRAAVYDAEGRRQLREGEITRALRERLAEGLYAGRREGRAEGRLDGKRETLRRLLRLRFGEVTDLERRIDLAGETELDELTARILTASTPDNL